MSNYDEMLNKPAFQTLEPERKKALLELMNKLENKPTIEAMAIILDFGKSMPKGHELSKNEQQEMMAAILENMNNTDKQKFSNIIKMMGILK